MLPEQRVSSFFGTATSPGPNTRLAPQRSPKGSTYAVLVQNRLPIIGLELRVALSFDADLRIYLKRYDFILYLSKLPPIRLFTIYVPLANHSRTKYSNKHRAIVSLTVFSSGEAIEISINKKYFRGTARGTVSDPNSSIRTLISIREALAKNTPALFMYYNPSIAVRRFRSACIGRWER